MSDHLPPTDPNVTAAIEIVAELHRQSLTLTEMSRLCQLPGRIPLLKALREGSARNVKPEVVEALRIGYQRFDAGDLSWRKVRSTRPEETSVRAPSDAKPQPLTRIEGSRLWDRLAQRRKELAA
jgi:hypothetical protein